MKLTRFLKNKKTKITSSQLLILTRASLYYQREIFRNRNWTFARESHKPLLHFSQRGELITRRGSIIERLFALGVIISFPVIFSPRSKEARSRLIYRAKLHGSVQITNRSRDNRAQNFRLRKESPTDQPLSPPPSLSSSRHAAYITSSLWIDNGFTLTRHALGTRGPRQISIFPLTMNGVRTKLRRVSAQWRKEKLGELDLRSNDLGWMRSRGEKK